MKKQKYKVFLTPVYKNKKTAVCKYAYMIQESELWKFHSPNYQFIQSHTKWVLNVRHYPGHWITLMEGVLNNTQQ